MRNTFICIVCPNSCEINVQGTAIIGAKCKRGITFVQQEMETPLRTVTTTLLFESPQGHEQIPVKTRTAIPLADIPALIKKIKQIRINERPRLGESLEAPELLGAVELIVTGGDA